MTYHTAKSQEDSMNEPVFRDRAQAGQCLGEALTKYANRDDVIVIGLPRGGVPVAYEVAKRLNAPLDVIVVRKLGVPGHAELAMGAIASGGAKVTQDAVIHAMGVSHFSLETVAAAELKELHRRELVYRGHSCPPDVRDKTVILVDDGIATGSTIRAAILALRHQEPREIIVAVPVASAEAHAMVTLFVDHCISLITTAKFQAVSQWYGVFPQTTDEEVKRLLGKSRSAALAPQCET